MAETSQSAMRVISLVLFTMIFAGAWANDCPREYMAQKEMPKPSASISQEADDEKEAVVKTVPQHVMPKPVLEEVVPAEIGMTMTISVETEGLTIKNKTVEHHIQKLPLGIANGDYLMVDADGGVGWLRIRGQQKRDEGELTLTTEIAGTIVRYMRVSPVDASTPIKKVPVPLQYAAEEKKTIR